MLVVDLVCAHGHRFEGWFQSADDLASQQDRGLLSCPVCGHHEVERRPSATRYNRSGVGSSAPSIRDGVKPAPLIEPPQTRGETSDEADAVAQLQAVYIQVVRHVMNSTEDVGDRFADEARRMHQGQEPVRAIRGQTSSDEAQSLRDEGIDVVSLLVPDALKEPLQ